jgi:hypothetical protein
LLCLPDRVSHNFAQCLALDRKPSASTSQAVGL